MLQTYTKQITLYPMQRFLWPGGWQLLFFMYIFTRLVNLHKKFGWEITAQCLLAWWYKTKLEYNHDYPRSLNTVRVLSRWNANPFPCIQTCIIRYLLIDSDDQGCLSENASIRCIYHVPVLRPYFSGWW